MIGTPRVNFSDGILNIFDFTKKVKFQPLYVGDLAKFLVETHHEKNKISAFLLRSVLTGYHKLKFPKFIKYEMRISPSSRRVRSSD